jgi:hypothetical protein
MVLLQGYGAMKQSIKSIILTDVTALRTMLGICALLFSFGFLFGDSGGGAYNDMLKYLPAWGWGIVFGGYGYIKLLIAAGHRPSRPIQWVVVIFGSALWLLTFHSFMENPNRPAGSADFILLALLFLEMWVGAAALSERRKVDRA